MTNINSEKKYCVDCKHVFAPPEEWRHHVMSYLCAAPLALGLVDKKPQSCSVLRMPGKACGVDAQLFHGAEAHKDDRFIDYSLLLASSPAAVDL